MVDAVETLGVAVLFSLHLYNGSLSFSVSDSLYALWVKACVIQTAKKISKHLHWIKVWRELESTYRTATPEEVASVSDICVVCHDNFDAAAANGPNTPVLLPKCEHMFHRGCFQSFLESATEGHLELKCPICRRCLVSGLEEVQHSPEEPEEPAAPPEPEHEQAPLESAPERFSDVPADQAQFNVTSCPTTNEDSARGMYPPCFSEESCDAKSSAAAHHSTLLSVDTGPGEDYVDSAAQSVPRLK